MKHFSCFFTLLLPALLFSQTDTLVYELTHPELEEEIGTILREGIAAGAFPGAQLLVAHRGKIIAHRTEGFHTYDSLRAVRADDIYDLASVTKASSALLALIRQHGNQELRLDVPLGELFPLFKRGEKSEIPLRDALAHQARLRPWVPYWQGTLKGNGRYPWRKNWEGGRTNDFRFRPRTLRTAYHPNYPIKLTDSLWLHRKFRERIIYRTIKKTPLEDKATYRYSGLLFYLLPEYVERSTGQDYRDYLRSTFYDPLGAHTLGYRPLDRGFSLDRIVPTEKDTFFRMQLLHGVVHDEGAAMMNGISANAGLFSNAIDLAKLWQMLLNGGSYGGRRYLAEASVAEFTRAQFPENDNRRGLGFDKPLLEYDANLSSVAEAVSPASFGHSGYTGTLVWADPEHEILFVFLSNRVYPSRLRRGIYELSIRPRLMERVYDYLLSE